jgi:hypothetical protein
MKFLFLCVFLLLSCEQEPNYQINIDQYYSFRILRVTNTSDVPIYYNYYLSDSFHQKPFMYFEIKEDGKWKPTKLVHLIERSHHIPGIYRFDQDDNLRFILDSDVYDTPIRMGLRFFTDNQLMSSVPKQNSISKAFMIKRIENENVFVWVD